jgi:hypothetical protein
MHQNFYQLLMKPVKTLIPVLALGILLGSCTQQYYRPRPNDPPLLSEAGQVKATASLSFTATPTVSASWSPARNLGLQAGFNSSRSSGYTSDYNGNNNFKERRSFVYAGVGYYNKFSQKGLFEIYGGIGSAGFSATGTGPVSRLQMTNFYVQPAIAMVRDRMELAFSVRYDRLQRGLTRLDTTIRPVYYNGEQKFLQYHGYDLLQPGITFRVGWPEAKFHFDLYESFVLNSDYETLYGDRIQNGLLHLSLGLSVGLNKLFK